MCVQFQCRLSHLDHSLRVDEEGLLFIAHPEVAIIVYGEHYAQSAPHLIKHQT